MRLIRNDHIDVIDILLQNFPILLLKVNQYGKIENLYYRNPHRFISFIGQDFLQCAVRLLAHEEYSALAQAYQDCYEQKTIITIRCLRHVDCRLNVNFLFFQFNPLAEGVIVLIRDITESILLEQEFSSATEQYQQLIQEFSSAMSNLDMSLMDSNQANRRLSALYRISSVIQKKMNKEQLFDELLDSIVRELDYINASIMILDEHNNELVVKAVRGAKKFFRVPVGKGITGYAALHRKMVYVPDVKKDKRYIMNADGSCDVLSEVAVPLVIEDQLIGILDVQTSQTRLIQQYDLDLLCSLASQIAVAITHILYVDQVETQAITDGLTGLYNYRYFRAALSAEFKRSLSFQRPLTLMMLDIDYFKTINDTYGHLVGDTILKKISSLIKNSVREVDYVVRYGGEEFAIILPEISTDQALNIAERIRVEIAGHNYFAETDLIKFNGITVSIGLADLSTAQSEFELIQNADIALYNAKNCNRNCIRHYKQEMSSRKVGDDYAF